MPPPKSLALLAPVLALLVARAGAAPAAPADGDLFPLSVVHLNDFHARFEQASVSGGACPEGEEDTCVGGIARVVTEARLLLSERPNALLLNAGDNFQGTLWFTLYGWNVTAAFLNLLPWDAFTLGNHEFDRKLASAIPFIKGLEAPVLVANLDDSNEPSFQGLTKKSIVVERGGRKIGIIGIITSTTKDISSPEQLQFSAEGPAVAQEGARLKAQGADIIVVLSHAGVEVDLEVALEDPNVDLVVGGHSHTLLYTGEPPGGDTAYDVYPIIVKQPSGRKVAVVQAGAYTKYLGNLTAFFDADGELVSAEGNPVYLDQSVEPDAATAAAMEPWAEGLEALADKHVGRSAVLLEQNDGVCGSAECNLGSFVADAYVHEFAGKGAPGTWTRAAIAFTNSGGLRAPIAAGNVTFNDLVTCLPFENTVDLVEMRGASLRRALEQSVSSPRSRGPRAAAWSRNYFGFLQVSGLHVTYDVSRPAGERVRSVSALCHACSVPRYEPLKDDQWYPVVINSFLGGGGDGYYVFPDEGRNYEKGLLDTDVMLEYFQIQDPVVQARDDRIVMVLPAGEAALRGLTGGDTSAAPRGKTASCLLWVVAVTLCIWKW